MVCFVHFDLEMCFAPQRRALFWHLNFQQWSENGVILYILTSKCASRHNGVHFFDISTQLPKVVREWCVLYILAWKCASRHNGVQFFISPLATWLRTRRFSEPTFRPSGATNHWKNKLNRDFPTFSRISIFFLLTLSLLLFSLLIFLFSLPLSILSEVWLLNFLRSWNKEYIKSKWYCYPSVSTALDTTLVAFDIGIQFYSLQPDSLVEPRLKMSDDTSDLEPGKIQEPWGQCFWRIFWCIEICVYVHIYT